MTPQKTIFKAMVSRAKSTHQPDCHFLAADVAGDLIRGAGRYLPVDASQEVRAVAYGDIEMAGITAALKLPSCAASHSKREASLIPSFDGSPLMADVVRSEKQSRGTLVFVHGFCGNRSENGLFQALAGAAAEAGFDTVSYDWRGIGDSGGEFSKTTMDEHVADFQSVSDWVRSSLGHGPLYAVGFSLGAAVIGLSLRQRADADAVAYLSPAVRPSRSMWPRYDTAETHSALLQRGYITKPGGSQLVGRAMLHALRDTDLGKDAFRLDVPLLVCHGTDDARVHHRHTQELVLERGPENDFGYLEIEGASHSFRPGDAHWRVLAASLLSWFGGERGSRRPANLGAWRTATHQSADIT